MLHLERVYHEQYILIEAKPTDRGAASPLPIEEDVGTLEAHVKDFLPKYRRKISEWRERLGKMASKGRRIVLWGSGSKAVSFLTTFRLRDGIDYVVDINPYRQGAFMPGTGQEIVAPDFLREYLPEIVIIMNAVYREEVSRDLKRLGLSPEVLTL